MTLLFDGENAFFAERAASSPRALVLHLPERASLFCNGICYFPENGSVKIPPHALRLGVNSLSLRMDNRLFRTESLYFDGEDVTPQGFPSEAFLLRQHKRMTALEDAFAALETRITDLEQKTAARTLFS